jgi:hypothetical protein
LATTGRSPANYVRPYGKRDRSRTISATPKRSWKRCSIRPRRPPAPNNRATTNSTCSAAPCLRPRHKPARRHHQSNSCLAAKAATSFPNRVAEFPTKSSRGHAPWRFGTECVVGAFPDGQSALNLAAARPRHIAVTDQEMLEPRAVEGAADKRSHSGLSQCRVPPRRVDGAKLSGHAHPERHSSIASLAPQKEKAAQVGGRFDDRGSADAEPLGIIPMPTIVMGSITVIIVIIMWSITVIAARPTIVGPTTMIPMRPAAIYIIYNLFYIFVPILTIIVIIIFRLVISNTFHCRTTSRV